RGADLVLLALLPVTAAFWGFATVAARAETGRVDSRLQAGLRATVAAYQEELAAADASAETLARLPVFERALVAGDRRTIRLILDRRPNLTVVAGSLKVGRPVPGAATRSVSVVGPHGVRGSVIAWVPLDPSLVGRLQSRSGLESADRVILIRNGRVVAGLQKPAPIAVQPGGPRTAKIGGTRYRVLVAGTLQEQRSTTLGVLSPQARIDAANWASE